MICSIIGQDMICFFFISMNQQEWILHNCCHYLGIFPRFWVSTWIYFSFVFSLNSTSQQEWILHNCVATPWEFSQVFWDSTWIYFSFGVIFRIFHRSECNFNKTRASRNFQSTKSKKRGIQKNLSGNALIHITVQYISTVLQKRWPNVMGKGRVQNSECGAVRSSLQWRIQGG